ncbi:MAG: hypothetical protein Q4E53_03255 [Eubacteriales bacterium]|nr:hypothetical protein [Eubacteriales bacterium]
MKKQKIIIITGLIAIFFLAGLRQLFIPYELHAEYLSKNKVYEYDQLSKEDFKVYTTSRIGLRKEVKDFHINSDMVSETGLVSIASYDPHLGVLVDLKSIKVKSSSLLYNRVIYEDRMNEYQPEVSEVITYSDGKKEIVPYSQSSVELSTEKNEDEMHIYVDGKNDEYVEEVPIITVTFITAEGKKSTKKVLSSDELDLTIHYSDGTEKKAKKGEITCEPIKKPKAGINHLTCYYNKKKYVVDVNCYKPKPPKNIVTFPGYGDIELQYTKAYSVKDANKLNTINGVVYFNHHRETYYTIFEAGGVTTAFHVPGRHVAEDGTIRDEEGYICVAADYRFCHPYEKVLTTLGPAKVYDTGCPYGTVDLYVNWR